MEWKHALKDCLRDRGLFDPGPRFLREGVPARLMGWLTAQVLYGYR